MTRQFLVRVGALGSIRPFVSGSAEDYSRRDRVLCRTERGLEVGEILAPVDNPTGEPAGTLVRAVTPDDDAHLARLQLRSDAAFRSCRQWMQQFRVSAVLMDVELLFDGNSLHFYFADRVPPRAELLKLQLARTYQSEVQFHSVERQQAAGPGFGEACGGETCCGALPGDASQETRAGGTGCATRACDDCSVADVCGKRKRLYGDVQTAR